MSGHNIEREIEGRRTRIEKIERVRDMLKELASKENA